MKLKTLVMLSSFLVLTTVIVCVSVYAYNAYAFASASSGGAGCNGWGLWNGTYSVMVKIDGQLLEADDHKHGSYHNGNLLSHGVWAPNDGTQSVYAEGYISGVDPEAGEFRSESDIKTYP